ncbi:hypothetical protein ABZ897_47540 [Nonomuraea sp. NPDC046802]|uniref:hypothetical protein n=1 Tax=Nonomuraea sp. NPDC046802 TaxID=3154919 RepID=UPI0033E06366
MADHSNAELLTDHDLTIRMDAGRNRPHAAPDTPTLIRAFPRHPQPSPPRDLAGGPPAV